MKCCEYGPMGPVLCIFLQSKILLLILFPKFYFWWIMDVSVYVFNILSWTSTPTPDEGVWFKWNFICHTHEFRQNNRRPFHPSP
jgi:hypothetical protein